MRVIALASLVLLASLGCASTPGAAGADAAPTNDALADASVGDAGALADGADAADASQADASLDAGPCDGAATWTTLQRLSPADLHALLQADAAKIIDVHTPYAGALPGTAAHIVYTDVDAIEAFLGHDRCAEVVLTCLGGPMSKSAGDALVARGYLRVRDLLGGMSAWSAAGYPLEP
jgi:rhodanese-related sulfurtransferase